MSRSSLIRYCSHCGEPLSETIPPGDLRMRLVCTKCGHIHYINPLPVCGTVPVLGERILLCRRAINPRRGFWTLPGGFLEDRESSDCGALRETREEAGISVLLGRLFAVLDVPFASQVHFFYLAQMASAHFAPGPETLECRLFAEEEIPWAELAFGTVRETLKFFFEDRRRGRLETHRLVFADNWHLKDCEALPDPTFLSPAEPDRG